jgi:hypothetical protein
VIDQARLTVAELTLFQAISEAARAGEEFRLDPFDAATILAVIRRLTAPAAAEVPGRLPDG